MDINSCLIRQSFLWYGCELDMPFYATILESFKYLDCKKNNHAIEFAWKNLTTFKKCRKGKISKSIEFLAKDVKRTFFFQITSKMKIYNVRSLLFSNVITK